MNQLLDITLPVPDLVLHITGDLTAITDLSCALIQSLLSSLEESIAARSKNGAGSSRDVQSQGEHNRQNASGGGIISTQHAQGLVSNYPLGNPAQQNKSQIPGPNIPGRVYLLFTYTNSILGSQLLGISYS